MEIPPQMVDPLEGHHKYRTERYLGGGATGFVVLARDKDNDDLVAVKFIERGPENITKNIERELINHSSLVHPHVIKLQQVFLTDKYLGIAMEYAPGGDLFQYVEERNGLSEAKAKWFYPQLILGLDYIHKKNISNRNIKLENMLLDSVEADGMPRLKICDFGYSINENRSIVKTDVGTRGFKAPEVLINRCKYDGKLADVWSSGVTLFHMLYYQYPFDRREDDDIPREQRNAKIDQRILNAEYDFPQHIPVSDLCKDLLSMIFVVDPTKRITIAGIWRHAWIQKDLPTSLQNIDDYNNHRLGIHTRLTHIIASYASNEWEGHMLNLPTKMLFGRLLSGPADPEQLEEEIKALVHEAAGGNDHEMDFHDDDLDEI